MTHVEAMRLALDAMKYADACLKKQLTTKTKHEYAQDLLMDAGVALSTAIAEAEKQEPMAWKNAAIRLGEELSSVGPNGYYNMTAEQWLDWAMDQQPQGKNSLTTPPAAQRQHMTDGSLCWCEPETSYTDPETGASVIVHKAPQ